MNPPLGNRRSAVTYACRPPRQRTFLNGKLALRDGGFTLDCTIHDISESGAKVIMDRHAPLPVDLYLIVVKHCVAYEAKVMWMNYPARGLKFVNTYSLSQALPTHLTFLRKLWGELYMRNGWVAEP
jgi:PilZ domain-containing protein